MKRKLRQLLLEVYNTAYITGYADQYNYTSDDPLAHRAIQKERTPVIDDAMFEVKKLINGKAKPKGKKK